MRQGAELKHFKIDNHNVTTARCIFDNLDTIIVYFDYDNNQFSTTLYYDLKRHSFIYNIVKRLTDRQADILTKRIEKFYA